MDTPEKILEAAEQLFADKGFGATSLRSVVAAAGVNVAAIHYHFGSKEGLIRAVFARRLGPINAARIELLDKYSAAAAPQPVPVEEIVEAFIRPAFAITSREAKQSVLARMFGRLHTEAGGTVHAILLEEIRELLVRFHTVLRQTLPELSETERVYRFSFVISAMAAVLMAPERIAMLSQGRVPVGNPEATISYLLRFCSAGLRAPASDRVSSDSVQVAGGEPANAGESTRA